MQAVATMLLYSYSTGAVALQHYTGIAAVLSLCSTACIMCLHIPWSNSRARKRSAFTRPMEKQRARLLMVQLFTYPLNISQPSSRHPIHGSSEALIVLQEVLLLSTRIWYSFYLCFVNRPFCIAF